MGNRSEVEIDIVVKGSSEMALRVNFGVPKDVWIPKSQISDWSGGETVEEAESIFIPEWLAIEKGMV